MTVETPESFAQSRSMSSTEIGTATLYVGITSSLSRAGIVLTLVTRNSEGHLAYRSQSEPPRGRGTTLGGSTDDPRRQGTWTAPASHPAGRAAGQRQPGVPGGRDLAGPVLSLAPAAGAGWAGWAASAPAPGPAPAARAAGGRDRAAAAERGRQRRDLGGGPDRGGSAPPLAAARGPHHRAAGLAARRAGDTPAAAHRARASGPADGGPAHGAHAPGAGARPARRAAARRGPRARRAAVPGHLLHRAAQGRGQGLADHRLRCRVLLRHGLAAPGAHRRSRRPLSASGRDTALPPSRLAAASRGHRRRPRVQRRVR